MTVPFGIVPTMLATVPAALSAATDQPAGASAALTMNGELVVFVISMYSSADPAEPCSRNSLMSKVVEPAGCTVTVKVWVVVLLSAFVPVTVTVVVPMGKNEPEAGLLVTTPQAPVKVGAV